MKFEKYIKIIVYLVLLLLFSFIIISNFYSYTKKIEGFDNNYKFDLAICSIIKDEKYIEEFIVYHSLVGVKHFYLYDNGSNPPLKERLDKPFFNEICTIIDFAGENKSIPAFNDCINSTKDVVKWLMVIDGDELVYPKKNDTIIEFLNNLDTENDIQAVGINWVMYGSSFYEKKQDGLLIDKYRYNEGKQNKHIKTICKPKYASGFTKNPHQVDIEDPSKYVDPHKNVISGPFNENNTIDLIQINHYYMRSVEEQIEKRNRGRSDMVCKNEDCKHKIINHSQFNDVIDNEFADKYKILVENKLKEI